MSGTTGLFLVSLLPHLYWGECLHNIVCLYFDFEILLFSCQTKFKKEIWQLKVKIKSLKADSLIDAIAIRPDIEAFSAKNTQQNE